MKNKFETRGDKVAIFLKRRDSSYIETIIDKNHLDVAMNFNGSWCAGWSKNTQSFYAVAVTKSNEKWTTIYLHRLINEPLSTMYVDHINHDTLDNTSGNLRNVSRSGNLQNQRLHTNNTSGFRGVSWDKKRQKWQVQISLNGIYKHLGYFDDMMIAAETAHKTRSRLMQCYVS